MPSSRSISHNARGMAMSIDALLAVVLFIALVAFISLEPVSEIPITQPRIAMNQVVDDAIAAMDSTGFIMEKIEDNEGEEIENKMAALLSESIDFRLELKKYGSDLDELGDLCREEKTFESCFPNTFDFGYGLEQNPKMLYESTEVTPDNKEIFHGKKVFIKKEPGDCKLAFSPKQTEQGIAYFQGNHSPEARDVNITIAGSCPGERHPCPPAGSTMRCCYEFYDEDPLDSEVFPPQFKWYKYDMETDEWLPTGDTEQTVTLGDLDDTNRWKCSVRVKDNSGEAETEWSQDYNSAFAIVGGPCFQFESTMDPEPMQCGVTSTVSFTVSAQAGGRRTPVDIMLSMDRSGSMSWLDYYDGASGTERSVFADTDNDYNNAFLGTSSYIYKLDVNMENGGLEYQSGNRISISDVQGLYVDGDYVIAANGASGLEIINKNTMASTAAIRNITTARELDVSGDHIFVSTTGEREVISMADGSAKVTGVVEEVTEDLNSLDCSGGYMQIGDGGGNRIDWGSTKGTISFWIKFDNVSGRPWGQHNDMEMRISSNGLVLDWGDSRQLTETGLFTTGKWYFVAVTWDEDTDDLYLYIGDEDNLPTLADSNPNWTRTVSDEGVIVNNFMNSRGTSDEVRGKGEELRYYDTDRSLAEIQSDYRQELVDPGSEPNLVSYFKLDGDFTDSGSAASPATGVGSTDWSSDTPLGIVAPSDEKSLNCDGGYMVVGNGNPDWGSTSGTISFWVKRDVRSNNDRYWGQHNEMEIRYSSGNLVLDWGVSSGGSYYTISVSDPLTETGKWYFVAVTWDQGSDDLYLYVGDEDNLPTVAGSNTNWTRTVTDNGVNQQNRFMRSGSIYGEAVNGKGEELRYYDTDRSLAEIRADYLRELSGGEPNLVSYFKLNGDFVDEGPVGDDGYAVGTTNWSSDTPMPSFSSEARIGYDSSESWAAQSFKPTLTAIKMVALPLAKTGSPSDDITVHFTQTINGADMTNGTATISAASVEENLGWVMATFPNDGVTVTPGQTYYVALRTTGSDPNKFYRWGSVKESSDQYSDGTLWECTSADICTKRQPPNQSEYEDGGFQLYYDGLSPGGLVIIDKSDANPNNWFVESSLYDTGSGNIQGNDIVVSGNYAYITDNNGDAYDGLWIVEISDTLNPAMTGFLSINNAVAVAASANYAYVIEEDTNLHIIDVQDKANPTEIPTTLGDLDDVEDVFVDGTRAYVTANNTGAEAFKNGVHVIDVSDPPNASLIETFYFPYGTHSKLFVGERFGYIINTSYGVVTVDKMLGPKMNMARDAAQEFVLFEDWAALDDKLGVVSYGNSGYTLNSQLREATPENKAIINEAIANINANGNTPLALGLREALDELLDSGRGRTDAVKFIILLADGQCNYGCSDLDNQISRARTNEVYVFTIGFGGDIGTTEETQMKTISNSAYCGESGLECGTYNHAGNPEALAEIYELISQDIAELAGLVPDGDKTNIYIPFEQFSNILVDNISPEGSSWDETTLRFLNVDITDPWTASFDVLVLCDYEDCAIDFQPGVMFWVPTGDMRIEFAIETEAQDPVYWPENFSSGGEFYYQDLLLEFSDGRFSTETGSSITYSIENRGYVDLDLDDTDPTMRFYIGETCSEFMSGEDEWFGNDLKAYYGPYAGSPTSIEPKPISILPVDGWICAELNPNKDIAECSENNEFVINCAIPVTFVYALDYWAWEA